MATKANGRPRGRARWSRLSAREQNRLRYKRSKWRAQQEDRQTSSALLLIARTKLGLSQAAMAKKLKVSLRSYKRYEVGESIPRIMK